MKARDYALPALALFCTVMSSLAQDLGSKEASNSRQASTSTSASRIPSADLPAPDADGFIRLFNGKDLTGWEGLEGYWSVKDGAIDGSETRESSKQTFLILSASKADPKKFANFELHFQYILHAARNEAGLNVWKLCVIKDCSFSRCSVGIFARQSSMAARNSTKVA